MSTSITLNLNENTVYAVEELAQQKGISIDKLAEVLFEKAAASHYQSIDDLPVADWVLQLGEGKPEYNPKTRKEIKEEYFESKK